MVKSAWCIEKTTSGPNFFVVRFFHTFVGSNVDEDFSFNKIGKYQNGGSFQNGIRTKKNWSRI
jgi:hypothetical protein